MAESKNLEEMFKDRYTEKDERYKKMAEEGFEKVVVIHPWNPKRDNFNQRGGGRGGFRGNFRGGWNPRGRGAWRGGQQWRGGDRQRQHE